jgi:hypothetical protein
VAIRTYRYHGNKREDDRSEYIELTDAHGVRRKVARNEDIELTDDQYAELVQHFELPRSTGQPVTPPPTLSNVRAQLDAPRQGDSIIYDEGKGIFVNDDLAATLTEYLTAIAARNKEPHRRVRIRNDCANPRGVGLTGWTTGNAFLAASSFSSGDIDDSDFALPEDVGTHYGANGHAGWCKGNMQANANAQIGLRPSMGATSGLVPAVVGLITFLRCKVKVISCPPDCKLTLESVFDNTDGSGRIYRVLDTVEFVNPGDIIDLEGFSPATAARVSMRVLLTNVVGTAAGWAEIRIGQAHIVTEPDGDVPRYVDGYCIGGAWDGAVNNSSSYGYVWPIKHDKDTFKGGFNFFQLFHTDSPADAETVCDYAIELGLTNIRMSMGGGPMGCDGAWPAGQKEPDWDNPALNVAKLVSALRKRGLKYTLLAGAPCTWMTTDGSNGMGSLDLANYKSDWIRLHTSLIDFCGDVLDSVEIENEVNLVGVDPVLWNRPDVYTQRAADLYDAIKSMRPDITVVGGCMGRLAVTDPLYGTNVQDYLTGMYNEVAVLDREPPWDVISVHPYTDDLSTGDPSTAGGFHSGFDQVMRQTRRALHNAGYGDTDLWVTEYGWPIGLGGTERSQSQYMGLLRGRMKRKGVKAAYFHTILSTHDVPAGWTQTFSFLELDTERRRPVFETFKRDGVGSVADWRILALINNWTNAAVGNWLWWPSWNAPGGSLAVRKEGNLCEIKGLISKTVGAPNDPIAILPEQFWPNGNISFPITVYTGTVFQAGLLYLYGRNGSPKGQIMVTSGGSIAAGSLIFLHGLWHADT